MINSVIEVFKYIYTNKLKVILSSITIFFSIFIYILLSSLGNGIKNGFNKNFPHVEKIGINIYSGFTTHSYKNYNSGRYIKLNDLDIIFIVKNFSHYIKHIIPITIKEVDIKYNNIINNSELIGIDKGYFSSNNKKILLGSDFIDYETPFKEVIIGKLLLKDMNITNPLGKWIEISGIFYKIVGVYDSDDGDYFNKSVIIRNSLLKKLYTDHEYNYINIIPWNTDIISINIFTKNLELELKKLHNINEKDTSGIIVKNNIDDIKSIKKFFNVLDILVIIISFGSLISGIVIISNIITYNVKIRKREIGIRKALGANNINIASLILIESTMITFIFGLCGIIFGFIVNLFISHSLEQYSIINPGISIKTFSISIIILFITSILSGYIPAIKASKINTVDALKD